MNRALLSVTAVTAVAVGGVVVARKVRERSSDDDLDRGRWHSVTVNCAPEELGPKPPPLDELGFPVEIRIQPAPGGRGTELAARIVEAGSVGELRSALRRARSLAEVGEVLLPDSPATTHQTLTGAPLAYATRHGREAGRL